MLIEFFYYTYDYFERKNEITIIILHIYIFTIHHICSYFCLSFIILAFPNVLWTFFIPICRPFLYGNSKSWGFAGQQCYPTGPKKPCLLFFADLLKSLESRQDLTLNVSSPLHS